MCFTMHYRLWFNLCCFCLISGFPSGSAGKGSTCDVGDLGLIPGLERFPGKGNSYSLQYPCLENSMDYIIHGVAKSWTRLIVMREIMVGLIITDFLNLMKYGNNLPEQPLQLSG